MMKKIYWVSLLLLCCSLAISFPGCTTIEQTEEFIFGFLESPTRDDNEDWERLRQDEKYIRLRNEESLAKKEWEAKYNEPQSELVKRRMIDGKMRLVPKSPEYNIKVELWIAEEEELAARLENAKNETETYKKSKLKEYRKERKINRRRAKVQPLLNEDPEYQKLAILISTAKEMISSVESQEEEQEWESKLKQLKSREEELVEQKWKIYIKEKNRELPNPEKEGNGGNGNDGGGGGY